MKTNIAAAFTSLLTVLAIVPYELGALATIIPPDWKAPIAAVGVLATAILRVLHKPVPPAR